MVGASNGGWQRHDTPGNNDLYKNIEIILEFFLMNQIKENCRLYLKNNTPRLSNTIEQQLLSQQQQPQVYIGEFLDKYS
jgi:hypothetical protein